jgi:hypothetical protein
MTRITGEIIIGAPADMVARAGGPRERATRAGLKRYLELSQLAAGPGAGEQPGPAPAAAADANGIKPPGQGLAAAALLACWQQRPGAARMAAAAAAATLAVHAVREAIYLGPGHGSENRSPSRVRRNGAAGRPAGTADRRA